MPDMKGRVLKGFRFSLQALADLFFTRNCVVCGRALDPGQKYVCGYCLEDMPLTYFWDYPVNAAMERLGIRSGEGGGDSAPSSPRAGQPGCSLPLVSGEGGDSASSSPRAGQAGVSLPLASGEGGAGCQVYNAASLFFYRHESPWCELVRLFKYGRDEGLGLWSARLLGTYLAGGGLYVGVQAVVPVPLHPLKKWRRGFNQAEIIARGVAEGLAGAGGRSALPVAADLLRRRRYTSTQTRKSASARRTGIAGAFELNRRSLARLKAAGVRHVLLVDDVMTTGATISECIRLLSPHFTVSVATLGFVE